MKLSKEDISRNITYLREKCQDNKYEMNVYPVLDTQGDWLEQDGNLINSKTDFFSVCAIRSSDGKRRIKMLQKDQALVFLLIARVDDNVYLLLNFRSEPGLIGRTCLTTTIQSTPSNYLRKHGGKETPYVSYANNDMQNGNVIYDEIQYDWLDYYLFKTKRYMIREISKFLTPMPGYEWIDLKVAQQALFEDKLISNDLRALLLAYLNLSKLGRSANSKITESSTNRQATGNIHGQRIAIKELRKIHSNTDLVQYKDDCETGIIFVKIESKSREVKEWIQPLLKPNPPIIKCLLIYCKDARGKSRFAVTRRKLLNPMKNEILDIDENKEMELELLSEGKESAIKNRIKVINSAEGGRFYNLTVELNLIEVDSDILKIKDLEEKWIDEEELRNNVDKSLKTSLELRMAFSIYTSIE